MLVALTLFACATDYGVTQKLEPEGSLPNADPVTESFTIDEAPADILFYGDTSDSMRRHLDLLTDNIEAFTERLDDLDTDWHLVAVTGASGCNNGGVLTPETDGWQDAFADGIRRKPTTNVDQDEMGLQNVATAIDEADGGCNSGFLREGVPLHVIYISDENDESPGFDSRPDSYWQDYVDDMETALGDANLLTISVIGGDVPDGCGEDDPTRPAASAATGYADAMDYTGGEFLSICDEWDGDIDLLANSSVTRDTFVLTGDPDPDTIVVTVDGVEVTNWAWVPGENAVVFLSDAPTGGQEVEITFVPAGNTGVEGSDTEG